MTLLLLEQNIIKTEFLNTFSRKQKEATDLFLRLSLE